MHLDRPLVLVLGGATGTGKSSLATDIAFRLGISRITSTDAVRQVMRAFFAQELMPALHFSSFEAGEGLRIPMPDPDAEDRALYGFIQQAEQVAVGANAIIERAVMEGLSTVVEGVHLVPGLVAPERHHAAVVVQVVLAISDEDAHQANFLFRDYESGGTRAMERYLQRFGEIRRIQDYLVGRAERTGVPVIEAGDMNAALVDVIDLILERAGGRTRRARLGPWRFRQCMRRRSSMPLPGDAWPCPCTELVSVTERCALAAGRYLGRGDARGADEAATEAMVDALGRLRLDGHVVIGRPEPDHPLTEGRHLGGGGGIELELACDPVEGGPVLARGQSGALVDPGGGAARRHDPRSAHVHEEDGGRPGRQGAHRPAPARVREPGSDRRRVRPAGGRRHRDRARPAPARRSDRRDPRCRRPHQADLRRRHHRHHRCGRRGTNDHLAIGIGGALGGIISAAALRCLGGEIQGQLWPMSRTEIDRAAEYGITDISQIFGIDDLVRGDVIVVATGISNGDLLRGVRYMAEGARSALDRAVLALQPGAIRGLDPPVLAGPPRGDQAVAAHDSTGRGPVLLLLPSCTIVPAMPASKATGGCPRLQLAEALEIELEGRQVSRPATTCKPSASGPTEVERRSAGIGLRGHAARARQRACAGHARAAGDGVPRSWRGRRRCGWSRSPGPGPALLGRRRPGHDAGAARRRGGRSRHRRLPPDRRAAGAHRGAAERPRRRRRDRPGAGLRLADRRAGSQAALHPQRARLFAAVGRGGRLAALIGRHVALRLFATCEVLPVEEARRLGLGGRGGGAAGCMSRVESLASSITRGDREALAVTKRLLAADDDLAAHERAVRRAVGVRRLR